MIMVKIIKRAGLVVDDLLKGISFYSFYNDCIYYRILRVELCNRHRREMVMTKWI